MYLARKIPLDVEIGIGLTWNGPCILISKKVQQESLGNSSKHEGIIP